MCSRSLPRFSSLLALLLVSAASPAMQAQQTAATPTAIASNARSSSSAAKANKTPPLTEDALKSRYVGKMVFIRGFYVSDDLNFDMDGKVNGSPSVASFTLSALQIRKVSLSKKKLEFEADRYALHFSGALPYEDDSKAFDKVKISKKPVHIAIERELVVVPKVKKDKKKDKDKKDVKGTPPGSAPAVTPGSATVTASTAPPAGANAPPAIVLAPGTTTDPAHSAMLLNAALDKIFATDIDQRMMANLPEYWRQYFNSKRDHHEFVPADTSVLEVGGNVTAPKVLNSIDPSSNEYAQKFGVAGLAMLRTVVDASGKPEQIAIARPIGFGLDEKAVDAIKKSRFTPATRDGKPVPVVIDLVVTFRIYSNRTKPGSVIKGSKQTEVVASAWDSDSSTSAH